MFATKRVRLAAAAVATALLGGGAAVAASTATPACLTQERPVGPLPYSPGRFIHF